MARSMNRLGSQIISFRAEYTDTALKRTTPIHSSAPTGIMKVLRAIAKSDKTADFSGKQVSVTALYGETANSEKAVKHMDVLVAALSRSPFPLIETQKQLERNGAFMKASLYSMATGTIVGERYASVKLSTLGKYLMRHSRYDDIDSTERFRSFVPYQFLSFYQPFSTGHKSNSAPLNPEELFKLQIKMLEYGTYKLPDSEVLEIFKGYDVGSEYTVVMTNESVKKLYLNGYGSFAAIPDIEINMEDEYIHIKVPPLRSTSVKLKSKLLEIKDSGQEPFESFNISREIDILGNGLKLNVTKFKSKNIKEIEYELNNSSLLVVKFSTRFETIRILEDKDEEEITDEVIQNELKDIEDPDDNKEEKELENKVEELGFVDKGIIDTLTFADMRLTQTKKYNPCNFIVDIVPVYKELWNCLNIEIEEKIKKTKIELAELQAQLEFEKLLEKVTRPGVREFINDTNKEGNRAPILLYDKYKDKTDPLLPEGFTMNECNLIYEVKTSRGFNILAILFRRGEFDSLWKHTLAKVKILEDKLNNPTLFYEELKREIQGLIDTGEFTRKSKVKFKLDKEDVETDTDVIRPINYNPDWEKIELPVSIYYNLNEFIKCYGVNLYAPDEFIPMYSINCLNTEQLYYLYQKPGSNFTTFKMLTPKEIATGVLFKHDVEFKGIIPKLPEGQEYVIVTSLGRIQILDRPPVNLPMKPGEIITAWECINKETTPYLNIRATNYIGRYDIFHEKFKKARTSRKGLVDMPNALTGIITDIEGTNSTDSRFAIRMNGILPTSTDMYNSGWKFPKAPTCVPQFTEEIDMSPMFKSHEEIYVNNVFVANPGRMLSINEKYENNRKKLVLPEFAYINTNDIISKRIAKSVYKLSIKENDVKIIQVCARSTQKYKELDVSKYKGQNILDERLESSSEI